MEKIIYNYLLNNFNIKITDKVSVILGKDDFGNDGVFSKVWYNDYKALDVIYELNRVFNINNPTYLKPIINKWILNIDPYFNITKFWLGVREYPKHKRFRK